MKLRLQLLLRPAQKLKLKTSQALMAGVFFLALIAGMVVFIFQLSDSDKSLAENISRDTFRSYQGIVFQKVIHTSDRNLLVSDGTNFVKLDSIGNVIWSKTVSAPYSMIITGLTQTADGDFVAVCQSSDTSNYKIALIRIGQQGVLRWFKIFSAKGSDFAYGISADNDNGVMLTGGGCNISHFIMKIDQDGNASWMKDFGVTGTTGSAYKVLTDNNGNMLMAGRITSKGNNFISIVKTDEHGNFLWGKQIADQQMPVVKAFIRTTDGTYIIAGSYIGQGSVQSKNPFILKADNSGNVIWFKRIGAASYESINDLAPAPDGGVIAVGNVYMNQEENVNVLLMRLDNNGNIIWQKSAGNYDLNGAGYDDAYSICQVSDGNYSVSGMAYGTFITRMDLNGDGFCHQAFVSLVTESVNCQSINAVFSQVPGQIFDSETINTTTQNIFVSAPNSCSGTSLTSVPPVVVTNEKEVEISLFPNPNDGNFNINYRLNTNVTALLQIFDLTGKEVTQLQLPSFTHSVSMHLSHLTDGIYLYKITEGNKTLKKDKFIVVK